VNFQFFDRASSLLQFHQYPENGERYKAGIELTWFIFNEAKRPAQQTANQPAK
jgi:hypothetical protein